MKIYAIQLGLSSEDKSYNFNAVKELLLECTIEPNSLIVLPEMFGTGFNLNLSETILGEPSLTEGFLSDLARSQRSWVVGGTVVPATEPGWGINRALILNPSGEKVRHYDKIHPMQSLGEDKVHQKGANIELINIEGFEACPFICFDLRFPEIFRRATRLGATLFVVIACWPQSRIEHWSTLLRARAIENQAYVVGVNAIGYGSGIEYGGHSVVIDPKGKILASTQQEQGVLESRINLDELTRWRKEFPVLNQMLPECP